MGNFIIFAKDYTKVKEIIKSLETDFKLIDKSNLSTYLGIDITKNNDGSQTLSQPFLIDCIIKALNLENDSKVHDTPAIEILTSDKKEINLKKTSIIDLHNEYKHTQLD